MATVSEVEAIGRFFKAVTTDSPGKMKEIDKQTTDSLSMQSVLLR